MNQSSLDQFIIESTLHWGPLSNELVQNQKKLFAELLNTSQTESWLLELIKNNPEEKELYRDPQHGFILLAYTEKNGTYRFPHNHGSGWVIYGVLRGEVEMGTYNQHTDQSGKLHLIHKGNSIMKNESLNIYLQGDIHHTRCLSESALILRFTSCDLKTEDKQGRMIRYTENQ